MTDHAEPRPAANPGAIPAVLRVVIQQPCLTRYRVPVFRELARRPGIDLTVVFGEEAGMTNAAPDGFRAVHVPLQDYVVRGSTVRWHAAQLMFCDRTHADVVVLSWSTRYMSLLPGLFKARWNSVGTVLWGHGYSKRETSFRAASRARLTTLADSLLFYNRKAAHQFASRWSGLDRTFVALNCLDQEPIRVAREVWLAPGRLEEFRRANSLDGRKVILFVSRLLPENRLDLLVGAMKDIASAEPGALLVVIGSGPDEGRLKGLAAGLPNPDCVRFTGAIYGEDKIAPWFLSSTVFCYPTNIGLSLLHAFGYACPVVTSDKGEAQNPEIEALTHERNGLLYSDGNPESLTQTILRVLGDAGLHRELSRNALETATSEFTLDRMIDGFEAACRYAYVHRAMQSGGSNGALSA